MTAAVAHRGPDAEAVVVAGPATLGHRRLSIIDVAHGAQPMYSADGRWVLSYNGELYNYLDVRAELQRLGTTFRTDCDTEVVVEAFAAWGPRCLDRFNGEFGIAAYDAHEGVLHIARDRLGIRNMYYAQTAEAVVFASEAKALFASGLVRPEIDPSCLSDFLALRYVPAPDTGFRNVTCLAPGHRAEVRAEGLTIVRYWEISYEPNPRLQNQARAVEAVEALLTDAVRVRLMSDVPFGAYLSGGVDSSLIVAMMSRMLDRPVRAFTAGFRSVDRNERSTVRDGGRRTYRRRSRVRRVRSRGPVGQSTAHGVALRRANGRPRIDPDILGEPACRRERPDGAYGRGE